MLDYSKRYSAYNHKTKCEFHRAAQFHFKYLKELLGWVTICEVVD